MDENVLKFQTFVSQVRGAAAWCERAHLPGGGGEQCQLHTRLLS